MRRFAATCSLEHWVPIRPSCGLAQNNQIQAASTNEVTVGSLGILNTDGFSDAIGPLVVSRRAGDHEGNGVLTVGFGVSSHASSQNGIISGNLSLNGSTQTFDIESGSRARPGGLRQHL